MATPVAVQSSLDEPFMVGGHLLIEFEDAFVNDDYSNPRSEVMMISTLDKVYFRVDAWMMAKKRCVLMLQTSRVGNEH